MLAEAPGRPQRRRSQRQGLRVSIELFLDGRPLRVETRVVNESGALVLSPRELPVGTRLEAINLRSRQRAHVRVAWLGPRESESDCQLGLELNEPSRKFWGRAYSPAAR
jgi:hypothetical protein